MKIAASTFLVTGGASGLGAATARHLHALGARVVIADLAEPAGQSLAAGLGERARFVRTDVASEADGRAAVELARSAFGALHGLVNCAGIGPAERVLGREAPHRLESFIRCIHVNLVGTFNMLRLAAAAMAGNAPGEDGERGVIVNTASIAAYEGQIGQAAYSASKGGIVAMTLPIARELARAGIRVVTIAPGLFLTPLMHALPPAVQDSLGQSTPFPQRLGRPEEYAALVEHIAVNLMLNGEVIRLDGAVRLAPR
ncbi:MAG: 3-hydroxyacyl-CoA dehydrogenase [Gammaproteobacteria bacterium]|nr:3-hydroxyacyl-CoA dehydrogenase [Gammaproteobacteria bacterium]